MILHFLVIVRTQINMTIYDFDNDFAHYEVDENTQKELGQVWTPYSIIEQMMDKAGIVSDKNSVWYDETKTNLDPTMGDGNIVISMLYRRIVECGQNPIVALSNVYGVELDKKTLEHAQIRIQRFMDKISDKLGYNFTDDDWKEINKIIYHNFVCSDIFKWNLEAWRPYRPDELRNLEEKKKRERIEQNAKVESDISFLE